jgi:YHS domain-containing protein
VIVLIVVLAARAAADIADPLRTLAVDAVELVAGREVKGAEAFVAQRDGFTYLFSSAENKARFEREPQKYEIQLGGACARMGPLSGAGSASIYAVHAGRIYIFASPQCRAGFLKSPEKLLEQDEPPPAADEAARRRGAELVELAVRGAGGAERVDRVRTYAERSERTEKHGDKDYRIVNTACIVFASPGASTAPSEADAARRAAGLAYRQAESWNDAVWGHVLTPTACYAFGSDRPAVALVAAQRRALERLCNRHLLTIFRARARPDFIAAALGEGRVGERTIARVACAFDGTVAVLGLEAESGRVLTLGHAGRGATLAMGRIERTFTDWKTVDGVTLPTAWTATFDGQDAPSLRRTLASIEIDAAVDARALAPETAAATP